MVETSFAVTAVVENNVTRLRLSTPIFQLISNIVPFGIGLIEIFSYDAASHGSNREIRIPTTIAHNRNDI